jgi:hypothetical protein
MSTKIQQLAIILVVVAAVYPTTASVADPPASVEASVSFHGDLRGVASFIHDGDWFEICDRRKDNLPVAVRFSYIRKNGTIQRGIHWHTAGVEGYGNRAPNGAHYPGCSYGNHNFGETRSVWFHACVRHADMHLQCGRTEKAGA